MTLWLMVYSKKDDSLVAEYPLRNLDIEVMRRLWRAPQDDPMVGCFRVKRHMMPVLRQYLKTDVDFDPRNLEYFVETLADGNGPVVTDDEAHARS